MGTTPSKCRKATPGLTRSTGSSTWRPANARPTCGRVSSNVTRNNEMVTTVLGSCVAACVRDRKTRVGGMNHFLLPADRAAGESWSSAARYGSYAMEALINEVLKHGGARNRLEIKLFGGARMVAGLSDVGQQNIEFVQKYLRTEQLSPDVEDVGGDRARVVAVLAVERCRARQAGEERVRA